MKNSSTLYERLYEFVLKKLKSKHFNKAIHVNIEDIIDVPQELIKPLEPEKEFYKANFNHLYREYSEKYIAIRNQKVIAFSEDEKTIINKVFRPGEKRLPTYIVKVSKRKRSSVKMNTPLFR